MSLWVVSRKTVDTCLLYAKGFRTNIMSGNQNQNIFLRFLLPRCHTAWKSLLIQAFPSGGRWRGCGSKRIYCDKKPFQRGKEPFLCDRKHLNAPFLCSKTTFSKAENIVFRNRKRCFPRAKTIENAILTTNIPTIIFIICHTATICHRTGTPLLNDITDGCGSVAAKFEKIN